MNVCNFYNFFSDIKETSDIKFIFANGSRIWASKPAEIRATSGLNLSNGLRILFSDTQKFFTFSSANVALWLFQYQSHFHSLFLEIEEIHVMRHKLLIYLCKYFLRSITAMYIKVCDRNFTNRIFFVIYGHCNIIYKTKTVCSYRFCMMSRGLLAQMPYIVFYQISTGCYTCATRC